MASTFWARTDSSSANNPALNLTGASAIEITFVPSGGSGDLFLEYASGGVDPDTQISIGGTDYDFTFELSGTLPTLKKDGSQQVPDQFEASAVYIITVQDFPSTGDATRLAFMPDELATQAEMDAFGNGAIDVQNVDTVTTGAVCFASGTRILTTQGDVPVEELAVGDMVITLDSGPKPILWISQSNHAWPGSSESELPILISQGALGADMPSRDLVVSPQHKMLLSISSPQAGTRDAEVLAPAKGLTSLPGIRIKKGARKVTYFHILLEKHEVLMSEGVASESFYPGPTALKMLQSIQREEVLALVPGLGEDRVKEFGPQARRCLTCTEANEAVVSRSLSGISTSTIVTMWPWTTHGFSRKAATGPSHC